MDREERLRMLARRRRRRRRRRMLAVLTALLVPAAVIWLAVSGLRSCSVRTPEETLAQPPQTEAQPPQTAPPPTTLPAQTVPPQTSAPETSAPPETTEPPAPDESWKLLLVNAEHPLPEGYSVTLKELRNGHHVDERIYPELQQMFDDARAAGIHPLINESYRTTERQQQILDKYVAGFEAEGMSHDEAVSAALERVALPGTSEHELGLALDIIAEYDDDSSATWTWLKNNCWRYGFILRYPEDKTELTGITYEPWHFRYVGVPAAREITEQGLCLEEYLNQ